MLMGMTYQEMDDAGERRQLQEQRSQKGARAGAGRRRGSPGAQTGASHVAERLKKTKKGKFRLTDLSLLPDPDSVLTTKTLGVCHSPSPPALLRIPTRGLSGLPASALSSLQAVPLDRRGLPLGNSCPALRWVKPEPVHQAALQAAVPLPCPHPQPVL